MVLGRFGIGVLGLGAAFAAPYYAPPPVYYPPPGIIHRLGMRLDTIRRAEERYAAQRARAFGVAASPSATSRPHGADPRVSSRHPASGTAP